MDKCPRCGWERTLQYYPCKPMINTHLSVMRLCTHCGLAESLWREWKEREDRLKQLTEEDTSAKPLYGQWRTRTPDVPGVIGFFHTERSEDMCEYERCDGVLVDAGWYPEDDPNGNFHVCELRTGDDGPPSHTRVLVTKDMDEACEHFEKLCREVDVASQLTQLEERLVAFIELRLSAHDKRQVSSDAKPNDAISLIAAERRRQIEEEGFDDERDDGYDADELANAAACYAMSRHGRTIWQSGVPDRWPWPVAWWKPTPDDRIRELVKAGALIVAEIERRQRIDCKI